MLGHDRRDAVVGGGEGQASTQPGRHDAAAVLPGSRSGVVGRASVTVRLGRRRRFHRGALRRGVGSPVRAARQRPRDGGVHLVLLRVVPASSPGQIPVLAVAIAVGLSASLFVRTVIFPDRPRAEVRRLVRALRAASSSRAGGGVDRGEHDLDRCSGDRLDRLGETALMIDDWLDRYDAAQSLSVTSEDLALRVFDAQIAMEQLVSMLWALDPDKAWPSGLADAITALRIVPAAQPVRRPAPRCPQACRRGRRPRRPVDLRGYRDRGCLPSSPGAPRDPPHHHQRAAESATPRIPSRRHRPTTEQSGLNPSTKAAIQVAVATSAATILGELISPDRWYWAVLTAFLVFTGVSTRGEILTRAGHRIVGTIAGVVAGVLLAALVGHNPPVQIVAAGVLRLLRVLSGDRRLRVADLLRHRAVGDAVRTARQHSASRSSNCASPRPPPAVSSASRRRTSSSRPVPAPRSSRRSTTTSTG